MTMTEHGAKMALVQHESQQCLLLPYLYDVAVRTDVFLW